MPARSGPIRPYTVKAVAHILGVSPNTIRSWEIRYGAVTPIRTGTNRRAYTSEQVDRLKIILGLLNQGHSIGAIASLPETKLRELSKGSLSKSGDTEDERAMATVRPILEALSKFDFPRLVHLIDLCRVSHSTRDFVLGVVSPLMGKVGEMVMSGKLSIAHEHALSAIIRDQVGQTMQLLRGDSSRHFENPVSYLFAAPEGDLHEFGILLGAALCANYGFRAYYLGPNLPASALSIAVKALKPTRIVLANSPRGENFVGPSFETYLRELNESIPPAIEVWIGGQGEIPHLRAVFGKRKYAAIQSLAHFDKKIEPK